MTKEVLILIHIKAFGVAEIKNMLSKSFDLVRPGIHMCEHHIVGFINSAKLGRCDNKIKKGFATSALV